MNSTKRSAVECTPQPAAVPAGVGRKTTKIERLSPCAHCQSQALKVSAIRRRDGVWHLLIKCRGCDFILNEPTARADFDRVTSETFAAWNGQKVAA